MNDFHLPASLFDCNPCGNQFAQVIGVYTVDVGKVQKNLILSVLKE